MADAFTNTELAIIGLVAEGPRYGYQLEQDIESRGMRNWTEIGFSSIYYVLNKLEKGGWLQSERQVESGEERGRGLARRVYRLTEAGWRGYHAAVSQRLAHPRPRSGDFELALANLPALSPPEARAALESFQAELRARLEQVRAKWAADQAEFGAAFPAHAGALFDYSVAMIRAELAWVEEYLKV